MGIAVLIGVGFAAFFACGYILGQMEGHKQGYGQGVEEERVRHIRMGP